MTTVPDTEKIPLAKPEVDDKEMELLEKVIHSGDVSYGPMGERFEADFAEWLGIDVKDERAVAVSSGTAALHLGVRALGWGKGHRVLTSPLTFVASANCLLYEGAEPVFCDVERATLNLDPAAVEDALAKRPAAGILPVHIFGFPAAMPALEAIAERHELGVLEDACQALGAVDAEGRKVGTRGNLATFAFYANKQLTTGEGGMIVAPDATTAKRLRSERNQGRKADTKNFEHDRLGFNYRLSDLSAALGVAQVKKLNNMLEKRERVAELYEAGLAGIEGLDTLPSSRGSERRSWFVYPVLLPEGADREATIDTLEDRHEIEVKQYLPCIHLFPQFKKGGWQERQFPNAEAAADRALALPFFPSMSESQIGRVCEALAESLR